GGSGRRGGRPRVRRRSAGRGRVAEQVERVVAEVGVEHGMLRPGAEAAGGERQRPAGDGAEDVLAVPQDAGRVFDELVVVVLRPAEAVVVAAAGEGDVPRLVLVRARGTEAAELSVLADPRVGRRGGCRGGGRRRRRPGPRRE